MQLSVATPSRFRAAQHGFTLVEATIGILTVGVLIVSLYAFMMHGMRTAQWAREDMRATQLLQEKLEKLRLYTWEQLVDGVTVPTEFAGSFNPEDSTLGGPGLPNPVITKSSLSTFTNKNLVYSGALLIEDGPSDVTYGTEMKKVTVRLSWTSSTGLRRERAVTTFVSQYGLQTYSL